MSQPSAERAGRPTLVELRAVAHPARLLGDASREHWMGRLYMRRISLHLTRWLAPTPVSPDGLTAAMMVSGLAAAVVLTIPEAWATIVAVLLVQAQVLFDCSDGELARWRGISGARGVYLDRLGHYTTDAAVVAAVGVHADGGLTSVGGWTTLGLCAAVLVLVSRAETDLVHVARSAAGMRRLEPADVVPRAGGVRTLRRLVYRAPVNRLLLAWDLSVVLVVVAVVGAATGSQVPYQVLTLALVGVGLLVLAGHLLSVLMSARLR